MTPEEVDARINRWLRANPVWQFAVGIYNQAGNPPVDKARASGKSFQQQAIKPVTPGTKFEGVTK